MGGAKRYPSIAFYQDKGDGFRRAQPILFAGFPAIHFVRKFNGFYTNYDRRATMTGSRGG
jgi:hypothetical protein